MTIKMISQTPTLTLDAYTANDALGTKLTFSGAGEWPKYSGTLLAIILTDAADQTTNACDLVLFDRDFTATTDAAAFDPSDADLANCIGAINIPTTAFATFVDNAVATHSINGTHMALPYKLQGGSLYGQLVTRATPDYAAADDITVKIIVDVD
jgi:hypothetical protein